LEHAKKNHPKKKVLETTSSAIKRSGGEGQRGNEQESLKKKTAVLRIKEKKAGKVALEKKLRPPKKKLKNITGN